MNFDGLIVGIALFLVIMLSRKLCIAGEYYFTKRFWMVFLILGIAFLAATWVSENLVFSSILGLSGWICLWGIHETIEQEERVKKGWFPKHPKRN